MSGGKKNHKPKNEAEINIISGMGDVLTRTGEYLLQQNVVLQQENKRLEKQLINSKLVTFDSWLQKQLSTDIPSNNFVAWFFIVIKEFQYEQFDALVRTFTNNVAIIRAFFNLYVERENFNNFKEILYTLKISQFIELIKAIQSVVEILPDEIKPKDN